MDLEMFSEVTRGNPALGIGREAVEHMDWDRIPGPAWYLPKDARAAMEALVRSADDGQAARALADLRYAVTNDHAGTLYPAAVPATSVLLEAIGERPGPPRQEALNALLDWWGCFHPEPGFGTYVDPSAGSVGLIEGIMRCVRDATDMLHRVADDPSGGGGHRAGVMLLLARLDEGWNTEAG
ncbi:hypothetical protein Ppa06_60860 [Planomonospora parontospora subsp. parontospora]|uniref:Uncharacterized protein n=3 Tax=Planomonospora parontospora TaxID=58119 RepID=A0AA37F3X8_9ACTN|nr:hypothetical protein GCM10010126_21660 [Planomonospora parontospora]GII12288.1 hypothetical protein Ppa06_60860 [Planomonospora parontospora subsp. parontospora]